jgi:hypothetical protein
MLLSLITASLAESADLHIVQVTNWEEICSLAEDGLLDVLIYDLDAATKSHILSLLFLNPRLLMIGLDVETNRALLISGKETRSLTMDMVKDLILSC